MDVSKQLYSLRLFALNNLILAKEEPDPSHKEVESLGGRSHHCFSCSNISATGDEGNPNIILLI